MSQGENGDSERPLDTEFAHAAAVALLRSAELLGVDDSLLAAVLGVSESAVARMAHGAAPLQLGTKESERATLLILCSRALDALVGGDDEQRRKWMSSHNKALKGTPRDLIATPQGLELVAAYLDNLCARL